jgi:DNA repair exonuclease SbcCD ATPase subunit
MHAEAAKESAKAQSRMSAFGAQRAQPYFGEQESVTIDESPRRAGDVSKPIRKAKTTFEKALTDLQDDLSRGLIDEQAFASELVRIRRTYFEAMRDLDQRTPNVDLSGFVDVLGQRLKSAQARLERFKKDSQKTLSDAFTLTPEDLGTGPGVRKAMKRLLEDRAAIVGGAGQMQGVQGLSDMEDAIRRASSSFDQMGEDAEKAFFEVMDGATSGKAALESFASGISEAAVEPLAEGIGTAINPFKGFSNERKVNSLRLNRQQLKRDLRLLRENLRQREISYTEYQMRVKRLNQQLAGVNQRLAEETASIWRKSLKSIAGFVEQTMEQVIQKIGAAIVQALMLKAISSAFGGPMAGASIGSLFAQGLGMGSTSSLRPAGGSGSGGLTMETRIDKGDLVVSLNSGQRDQSRYGGTPSRVS